MLGQEIDLGRGSKVLKQLLLRELCCTGKSSIHLAMMIHYVEMQQLRRRV